MATEIHLACRVQTRSFRGRCFAGPHPPRAHLSRVGRSPSRPLRCARSSYTKDRTLDGAEDHSAEELVRAIERGGHRVTASVAHRHELVRAVRGPCDLVAIAGGDGTVGARAPTTRRTWTRFSPWRRSSSSRPRAQRADL